MIATNSTTKNGTTKKGQTRKRRNQRAQDPGILRRSERVAVKVMTMKKILPRVNVKSRGKKPMTKRIPGKLQNRPMDGNEEEVKSGEDQVRRGCRR